VAILILDLDLTVFAEQRDIESVIFWDHFEKTQDLHEIEFTSGYIKKVKLINPELLSDLIQYACTQHDGVMFFTSGDWEEASIKSLLKSCLDLDAVVDLKFANAAFINVDASWQHFGDKSRDEIQCMDKNLRLDKFRELYPAHRDTHFVFVDDNLQHIESFEKDERVHCVHATTDVNEFDYSELNTLYRFYGLAKTMLEHAKFYETKAQQIFLHIDTNTPPASPVKLSRKRERIEANHDNESEPSKHLKAQPNTLFSIQTDSYDSKEHNHLNTQQLTLK